MRRITLGIVVFVSLFFMIAPALAGTVSLSPSLGPPGTTIIIGYSGSLPDTDYTCNIDGGADMGWIPQTSTFSYNVPMGTPTGTLIYVNCRQEWVDEPDASTAIFTVTSPDSDGDGMPDDIDQCPNLFGQTQNGCPDSDGDGVTDNVDQCPNEAGTLPNGCLPDSDGDGVPDVRDACLYEFGTLPNGCPPDSDGDGIGDYRDDCPYEFAQTQNGCPDQPTQPTSTPRPTVAPVTQPEQPVIVPTEEATPEFFIDPNLTIQADVALANCPDLRAQANRLAIGLLMRVLGSGDPCRVLTSALRDLAFGTLRDGEVKLIADAFGGIMRGTCGISPEVPSTEYLRMLRNAYRLFPTFAGQINDAVMALSSAADGTPERAVFCAFMALDGAGMNRLFPSPLNDGHRFIIAAAECLPSYPEDSELFLMRSMIANFPDYGYNAGMFLSAVNNPVAHPFMCRIFAEWRDVINTLTPDEQQIATALIRDCNVNWVNLYLDDSDGIPVLYGSAARAIEIIRLHAAPEVITELIANLNCDNIYTAISGWALISKDVISDLADLYNNRDNGGGFGNPQIPDFSGLIPRFRIPRIIDLIGGTTIPRIYPTTTIAGYVFEDRCDESAVDLDFREPLPEGCVEIGPRLVSSNNFWDDGEPAIGGIYIELINNDTCSGTPLYTTSPDSGGYFEFPNIEAGNYSLVIDADYVDNAPILGAGEWSYRLGSGARKLCLIYNLRGQMPPVMAIGYNRLDTASNTGIGNFILPPVFINIRQIDDGGEVSWRPPPIPPLTEFGIDNPSDVVSWRPPPIPPYEALVRGLAYAPPPNVALNTAVDGLAGRIRWEDFSFEMDTRGILIGLLLGDTNPTPRLLMAQNGGLGEFELPNTPLNATLTPDGKLAGIIGENPDGTRTISLLNVENGFWIPIFTGTPDINPTGDTPFFVAELFYFSATDANGVPSIYRINPITPSNPELVLDNALLGSMTLDGILIGLLRDGNIYVQNTASQFTAQITNTGDCSSPTFDAIGFNLYYICGGKLFVYGLDGIKPIVDDIVVSSVGLGPVDGTLIFGDGQSYFMSDLNGANRRPFMNLSNFSVTGIRWQPPLPMPAPEA